MDSDKKENTAGSKATNGIKFEHDKDTNFVEQAKIFLSVGLNPIRCKIDKTPDCISWKYLQTEKNQPENFINAAKIGIVCGKISNNLTVLDVDCKNDKTGNLWTELSNNLQAYFENYYDNLCIIKTISGGYHIPFYCTKIEGNLKLARNKNKEIIIETRGDGGYVIAPYSDGYTYLQHDYTKLPSFTETQYKDLLNICRSFNEEPQVETTTKYNTGDFDNYITSPFDEYNNKNKSIDLLTANNWTICGSNRISTLLTRPGKTNGVSGAIYNNTGLFHCFTTSTQFDEKTYNAVQIYTILNHNGNFSNAAKELIKQGYGVKNINTKSECKDETTGIIKQTEPKNEPINDFSSLYHQSIILDFTKLPSPQPIVYAPTQKDKIIFYRSTVNGITGKGKSRKTSFIIGLICDAINNNPMLKVCWIDTEQAKFDMKWLMQRINKATVHFPNFDFFTFRGLDIGKIEPITFVEYIAHQKQYDIIVIDNITDLDAGSIMDMEPAQKLTRKLMQISETKNIGIIGVVHENEKAATGKQGRGHIGSEFIRKCHTVISLSKDGILTNVDFTTMRYLSPDNFYFEVDSDNMPIWNKFEHKESISDFIKSDKFLESLKTQGFGTKNKPDTKGTAIKKITKALQVHCPMTENQVSNIYLQMIEALQIIHNSGTKNKCQYYLKKEKIEVDNSDDNDENIF